MFGGCLFELAVNWLHKGEYLGLVFELVSSAGLSRTSVSSTALVKKLACSDLALA